MKRTLATQKSAQKEDTLMDRTDQMILLLFLCASVILLAVPFLAAAVRWILGKKKKKRSGLSGILKFSACLLGAIWCLRYAVGYYTLLFPQSGEIPLTRMEELFNSAVHALQTMSMDEDYTEYIIQGKAMMGALFGDGTVLQSLYGIYAAALNLVAPIAGGAILFQILANIFPQILLKLSFLAVWKEKYYFSDLNEASLAVARDLSHLSFPRFCRPVLIFTDAYACDGNEGSSEFLEEAKHLGALCVKDDLTHVAKSRRGRRTFFLMEEEEIHNLRELTQLAGEKQNCRCMKGTEIVLFSQSDIYAWVEQCVRKQWKEAFADPKWTEEDLPVITPIQRYRNLIHHLLEDIPLYEPLIGKGTDEKGKQELHVAILGTGTIGMEMFLACYWFGQILDCDLYFHMVSQESEESFWGRVDSLNPEIRRTMEEGDAVLEYNRNRDCARPYGKVFYTQCDVHSEEFTALLHSNAPNGLLQADYFLVALGSDEENMTAAEAVRHQLSRGHFVTGEKKQAVVAYVIFDSDLARTLNGQCYESHDEGRIRIYTEAVGSLDQLYSIRNIFMREYDRSADEIDQYHKNRKNTRERFAEQRNRAKSMIDNYNHWSSRARVLHRKYKAYSAGLFQQSLFDFETDPDAQKAYKAMSDGVMEEYRRLTLEAQTFASEEEKAAHGKLLHDLAWLEHRRWNAYARARGFTNFAPEAPKGIAFVQNTGVAKNMELQFHGCLVECDRKGARGVLDPCTGLFDESTFLSPAETDRDFLDELSYVRQVEYKKYDYPYFDTQSQPKTKPN